MLNNLKVSQKGFLLVIVPVLFEVCFLGLVFFFLSQSEAAFEEELKSKALIEEANSVSTNIYKIGSMLAASYFDRDMSRLKPVSASARTSDSSTSAFASSPGDGKASSSGWIASSDTVTR